MAKLLMNDEIDHASRWYPTHIIGKDNTLLNVYIGSPSHMLGGVGIYVSDKDYMNINHEKTYVFVHNPDCEPDDIENVDWDVLEDAEDKKTDREHMHLWTE